MISRWRTKHGHKQISMHNSSVLPDWDILSCNSLIPEGPFCLVKVHSLLIYHPTPAYWTIQTHACIQNTSITTSIRLHASWVRTAASFLVPCLRFCFETTHRNYPFWSIEMAQIRLAPSVFLLMNSRLCFITPHDHSGIYYWSLSSYYWWLLIPQSVLRIV